MSESQSWLDGLIGWEQAGSVIETCAPDDPAIDVENSDIEMFVRDNFNMEHLKLLPGKKPVQVKISLPNSSQWASVQHHMKDIGLGNDNEGSWDLLAKKLFELCVRFPEVEAAKPEYRQGLHRLPSGVMDGLMKGKGWWVTAVGGWLAHKYMLSDEEKKA